MSQMALSFPFCGTNPKPRAHENLDSRSRVGKLWPMGQIQPLQPVFVNKFLLEYSHTHLFITYGCFQIPW